MIVSNTGGDAWNSFQTTNALQHITKISSVAPVSGNLENAIKIKKLEAEISPVQSVSLPIKHSLTKPALYDIDSIEAAVGRYPISSKVH